MITSSDHNKAGDTHGSKGREEQEEGGRATRVRDENRGLGKRASTKRTQRDGDIGA